MSRRSGRRNRFKVGELVVFVAKYRKRSERYEGTFEVTKSGEIYTKVKDVETGEDRITQTKHLARAAETRA